MGCKWHLLGDQLRLHKGRRAWQFLSADEGVALLEELPETCALDAADRGSNKLEEIGKVLRLTRERVRQIEIKGAARLGLAPLLKEINDDGP